MADDDIIERTPTSPMATSCTIITTVALLGAIAVGILEIGEVRGGTPERYRNSDNPAKAMYDHDVGEIEKKYTDMIAAHTAGDDDLPHVDARDAVDGEGTDGDGTDGDGTDGDGTN